MWGIIFTLENPIIAVIVHIVIPFVTFLVVVIVSIGAIVLSVSAIERIHRMINSDVPKET